MLPDRILSLNDTCNYLSISRWTIRRMRASGQFPQPIQLTQTTIGWRVSTLDAWANGRTVNAG
jgi:predicted DNA-binding transcriptional regulator AlpA